MPLGVLALSRVPGRVVGVADRVQRGQRGQQGGEAGLLAVLRHVTLRLRGGSSASDLAVSHHHGSVTEVRLHCMYGCW